MNQPKKNVAAAKSGRGSKMNLTKTNIQNSPTQVSIKLGEVDLSRSVVAKPHQKLTQAQLKMVN